LPQKAYCAIQVPFESLRRTTRERKYAIDEVQSVMSTLREASQKPYSTEEGVEVLDGVLQRLERLKRKVRATEGVGHVEFVLKPALIIHNGHERNQGYATISAASAPFILAAAYHHKGQEGNNSAMQGPAGGPVHLHVKEGRKEGRATDFCVNAAA